MRYDVIVVGGGPAGATAARDLALRGLAVLVLDAQNFPRRKVCGGGVTARTAALLTDLNLSPVVEDTTRRFVFRHGSRQVAVHTPGPLVFQVCRDRFDNLLLEAARQAGACVQTGEGVRGIAEEEDRVMVTTDRGLYHASFLVGADGARGQTARWVGAAPLQRWCGAVEWEVPFEPEERTRWRGTLDFDFGAPAHGYGWVFPKRDHRSVGVCTLRSRPADLRGALAAYMDRLGIDPHRSGIRRGAAPLAVITGRRCGRVHTRRTVLVGDAAGLTDPFSGEGIYYAVLSGRTAARVLAGQAPALPRLEDYGRALAVTAGRELRWSRRVAQAFYPAVGWFFRHLLDKRRTGFAELLTALARGDVDYRRVALRSVALVATGGRGVSGWGTPGVEVEVSSGPSE